MSCLVLHCWKPCATETGGTRLQMSKTQPRGNARGAAKSGQTKSPMQNDYENFDRREWHRHTPSMSRCEKTVGCGLSRSRTQRLKPDYSDSRDGTAPLR